MSKRICKVCGSSYSFCPDCIKDLDKPRWMVSYDKEACKTVFETLVKNSSGKISGEDALKVVKNSGVHITNASILNHVNRLESEKKDTVKDFVENSNTIDAAVDREEKKQMTKTNKEGNTGKREGKEERVDAINAIGKMVEEKRPVVTNTFISNSKNEYRTRDDAIAIGSALSALDKNMD